MQPTTKYRPTRFDWVRASLIMLAAVVDIVVAVMRAGEGAWGQVALFGVVGILCAFLAFAVLSSNPRVRRLSGWPRAS
jgi:uncharacterized membrane protein HdeD (DUF308 family)